MYDPGGGEATSDAEAHARTALYLLVGLLDEAAVVVVGIDMSRRKEETFRNKWRLSVR